VSATASASVSPARPITLMAMLEGVGVCWEGKCPAEIGEGGK